MRSIVFLSSRRRHTRSSTGSGSEMCIRDRLKLACAREQLSCAVSGKAVLTPESARAGSLWVLVVAYTQDGRVAGIRRWDSQSLPAGLDFSVFVYSAGPKIDHVEVFAEARPAR